MTDDSWDSPLGFSLEWGREWRVLAADHSGGIETMVLSSNTATLQMIALMDFSGDPVPCLAELEDVARDLFPGDTIRTRRNALDGPIGITRHTEFKVLDVSTRKFGSDGTLRVYVSCHRLVKDESVFGFILLADENEFEEAAEDLEILLDDGLTVQRPGPRDEEEFAERVYAIGEDVDQYFQAVMYREGSAYVEPSYVPFLGATETSCYRVTPEGQNRSERNYELLPGSAAVHCGVDQAVYLDQAWMETYALAGFGEAGLALITAHEVAHHIQHRTGWIRQFDPNDPDEMFVYESSADCLAGAYMRSAVARDLYSLSEWEALEDLMTLIADPEEGMGHGTFEQRIEAMVRGFDEGTVACGIFDD